MVLVPSTGRIMTPRIESAQIIDDFLQQAIGHATVIAHTKDDVIYVHRSELDVEIQQLAIEVISPDHAHFTEYVRFASMEVHKILDMKGKTIIEDDSPSDHGTESESDHNYDNANL